MGTIRFGYKGVSGLIPLLAAVLLAIAIAGPAWCVSLLPGWPQSTGYGVSSSPALGDLDGDGQLEVVVGAADGKVYAWRADGSPVSGWPQETDGSVQSSPALGDLDGDGRPEVVLGSYDWKVYAWHSDGSPVTGWPQTTGAQVFSSPALGDLDGDGGLEVVVGSEDGKVYAWHHDGVLVTGWPQAMGAEVFSSPALGDLDGDGHLEVVVASYDGNVYALHPDGALVAGWPQSTGNYVESSPALGDLDGDGGLEVLVGSYDWKVYAWHGDGSPVTGWPQSTGGRVSTSPALGDLDGDGGLEVVVGSFDDGKVYAWHADGSPVTGWSQTTGGGVQSSPALGDLDGDGHLEVVVGCRDDKVYAWHHDGTPVTGWPQSTGSFVFSSPALGDLDGDGSLEVVVGSTDRNVYAWTCDAQTADLLPWPMFRHDAQHTALHPATVPLPRGLAADSVSPGTGDPSAEFTWRVKYWDLSNVPATSVWIAIWSSWIKAPVWHRMSEEDPSDTNYADGKWYAYSGSVNSGTRAYRFAAEAAGTWSYWPQPAGYYKMGPSLVWLSSGYAMPSTGGSTTPFTWRVKYWNNLNQPPDEVWVAIWFPTLRRSIWRRMWALDASDTTSTDGKWYTFSRTWSLSPGAYACRFAARQGAYWTYWPKPAGTYSSGPTVGP